MPCRRINSFVIKCQYCEDVIVTESVSNQLKPRLRREGWRWKNIRGKWIYACPLHQVRLLVNDPQ
jgi:hypothetical protein